MRFPDPYLLRREPTKETVIFAASQLVGRQQRQEDYFLNFNDECFVLADGVSGLPNGDVASKLACDTAIWAYKHIRQHRYYWLDKKLFMKRIFRSTNMAVWQKRKEKGFEGGLATTLLVCMVGPKYMWLGSSGDTQAWLVHDGVLRTLTREKNAFEAIPKKALGLKRLGLIPEFFSSPFDEGDIILMITDGAADYLTMQDVEAGVAAAGNTTQEITEAVLSVLNAARINSSEENMTAVMIKRLSR